MRNLCLWTTFVLLLICGGPMPIRAQSGGGIDPEALIERILSVDEKQMAQVHDVTFDAEYVEGERNDEGDFTEKTRFLKKIYVKYVDDTAWFKEDYQAYYKDGELQSREQLAREAADRKEKKIGRKAKDISYDMLKPFFPDMRPHYDITYKGVSDQLIEGYTCYRFRVEAKEEDERYINGDYYIDAESFHLVEVDFSPAKLVKKAMFRLSEMHLTILYGPSESGLWFPRQFDIQGKGKAMLFIRVNFSGTEFYRNPVVNSGLSDDLFKEKSHD